MGTIAGFLALVMCVAWLGFVAETVIIITEHDPVEILAWCIAAPVFAAFEVFAWRLLDHLAESGRR